MAPGDGASAAALNYAPAIAGDDALAIPIEDAPAILSDGVSAVPEANAPVIYDDDALGTPDADDAMSPEATSNAKAPMISDDGDPVTSSGATPGSVANSLVSRADPEPGPTSLLT